MLLFTISNHHIRRVPHCRHRRHRLYHHCHRIHHLHSLCLCHYCPIANALEEGENIRNGIISIVFVTVILAPIIVVTVVALICFAMEEGKNIRHDNINHR